MAAYAALVSLMNTVEHIKIHPFISTTIDMEGMADQILAESTKKNGGLLQKIVRLVRKMPKKFHLSSVREDIGKVEKEGRFKDGEASSRPIVGKPGMVGLQDMEGAESLGETIAFLLDFIESRNCGEVSKEVEDMESRIASAAHTAEDAIESHVFDQLLDQNDELENGVSLLEMMRKKPKLHLSSVICDLQKVSEDVKKVEKEGGFKDRTPIVASSSKHVSAGKTSMVGFEDYLNQLMDRLTRQLSMHQIIPIIGMGGIGKTTLARNAFDNLLIRSHFDVCRWATISQSYSVREILILLLSSQEDSKELIALDKSQLGEKLDKSQLGEKLHKYLFGRRYLIVLDDMWSIDVWDEINFFFPDNNNGSCVVVTSRLHDISLHFNASSFMINFLDEDKSWNLFCQKSFGKEGCPSELEEVGKKICKNCKGLPLSIVVIGGFLRESNKSLEYWEGVARDTYSILDKNCMNILSLSYNHLPAHLKPCFLYMGVFAEDEKINVSRLIQLWVAEGFLRPNDSQTLEEVANGYLKDLVGRNLILVNRWGSNGKMSECNIHDLIRELCLSIAKKEQCLWVMKLIRNPRTINRECWIFTGVQGVDFRYFNVRFLDSWDISKHILKKLCLLWNLQTLRTKTWDEHVTAPSQIWEMIQLRHIKVDKLCLPDPPRSDGADLLLPNLQTLCKPIDFRLSEEVCKRIPNVKKLGLKYNQRYISDSSLYYCLQNLGQLQKLESLKLIFEPEYFSKPKFTQEISWPMVLNNFSECKFTQEISWRPIVLNLTFPSSLKKLSLTGGKLFWKDLEMIGSLPNLEVLKLWSGVMTGSEWNPVEGQFQRLKFLLIGTKLITWNADNSHFPVLEKLVFSCVSGMDEIPSGIGDIPTLRTIRVVDCRNSLALSAVKILEEQEGLGNEDLQVEVLFGISYESDRRLENEFRETVEQAWGFTSQNLRIERAFR